MSEKERVIEHGSTDGRPCPECQKIDMIIHFELDGEHKMLCRACLFDRYGYGKPKRKYDPLADYSHCDQCGQMKMKRIKGEEKVTDSHVIHKYECDNCGNKRTQSISKWRKGK